MNRIPSAKFASTLLLAAACILSSFAARAEQARAQVPAASEQSAAVAAPADGGDAIAASSDTRSGVAATPVFGFRRASLDLDTDLDAQYGPGPADEDYPAPPPPPPNWRARRRNNNNPRVYPVREARTGLLFGFGFGGAQQYVSGAGHSGGFDSDLRLGYGFSDRFQMFLDLGGSTTPQDTYQSISTWHFRLHGQTVLVGDRHGNGLNLNLGIGFGGATTDGYSTSASHDSSQVGVSVGGGLSFEGRITPHFALAPEVFASWQQVPNYNDLPSDISWTIGARLNFVWYSWF